MQGFKKRNPDVIFKGEEYCKNSNDTMNIHTNDSLQKVRYGRRLKLRSQQWDNVESIKNFNEMCDIEEKIISGLGNSF